MNSLLGIGGLSDVMIAIHQKAKCQKASAKAEGFSGEPGQYPPEPEPGYFPAGFDGIDQSSVGTKSIATEGSDNETEGDFMLEAQKLVDAGEATSMTEAMRKVHHQRPELHSAFKAESRSPQRSVDARQFKSNRKFIALCRRHKLCMEQYEQAKKGHPKIAAGILRVARENQLELRKLLAE